MPYGAAISEEGIPVNSASDDQKVLDTRWVTLDIVAEPTYNISATYATNANGSGGYGYATQYTVAYSHGLGYPPAFNYRIDSITCNDPSQTNMTAYLIADSNNIYFLPQVSTTYTSVVITVSLQIRVFSIPITNSYVAPTINAVTTNTFNSSNYGVQIAGPNLEVPTFTGVAPTQLAMSTSLRPLSVLQAGTYTIPGGAGSVVISFNAPYRPLYMMASYYPTGYSLNGIKIPGAVIAALNFQGGSGVASVSNGTAPGVITINGAQSAIAGSVAYILLKDPLDVAQ